MRVHPKDIPLYHLPKITNLNSSFQMGYLNPAEFGEGSSVPDRHSFYTIFWFTEGGRGKHYIDFIPYEIEPNTLFLFRPGQTHYFEIDQIPQGYRFFMEQDLAQSKFDLKIYDFFQLAKESPVLYLDQEEANELQPVVGLLLDEFNQSSNQTNESLAHLLKVVFIKIEEFYKNRYKNFEDELDGLIDQFQHLVEEHYFEQHRIKQYASQMGITADYLSERVKAVLGEPPSKLIHHRLMVEAKRLLAYTDLTSAEIGLTLGFNDTAYFSRFFKREASHPCSSAQIFGKSTIITQNNPISPAK